MGQSLVSNELNELTFSSFPPPPVVEGLPRTSDDMDAAQSYNLNLEWGATAPAVSDTDAVVRHVAHMNESRHTYE